MKRLLICLFVVFGLVSVGFADGMWFTDVNGYQNWLPDGTILWDSTSQPKVSINPTAWEKDCCQCCCECCEDKIEVGDWVRFTENHTGIKDGVGIVVQVGSSSYPDAYYVAFPSEQQGERQPKVVDYCYYYSTLSQKGYEFAKERNLYYYAVVNPDNESEENIELIMKGK